MQLRKDHLYDNMVFKVRVCWFHYTMKVVNMMITLTRRDNGNIDCNFAHLGDL
jgi:hypothetical protein